MHATGWIKMPLGTKIGLSQCHIVLDVNPAAPKRSTAPNFRAMSIVVRRSPTSAAVEHLLTKRVLSSNQLSLERCQQLSSPSDSFWLLTLQCLEGVKTTPSCGLLWPPCVADADITFFPVVSSFCVSTFLSLFLANSQLSQSGCIPCFHTWCGLSANLGCRSETCCTRLAENTARNKNRQKFAICAPSHNCVGLYLRN